MLCFKCGKTIENSIINPSFAFFCSSCYNEMLKIYSGLRVYRFLSVKAFLSMIKKKELVFSLPSNWSDSFEDIFFKSFLDARKSKLIDPIHVREILAKRDSYYCQCWTLTQESQFFWRAYGYDTEAIRIEIDLEEAFKNGLRIEPVNYQPFYNKEEWIKIQEGMGAKFALGDEKDIFYVNEDGNYDGDPSKKTGEMCYLEHLISAMHSIHGAEYNFETIPLPKIIATKQPQFMIENEVRLFVSAHSLGIFDAENEYYVKHTEYENRIFGQYRNENVDFNTYMPTHKCFSYANNEGFIKSILCHPNMSESLFDYIVENAKNLGLFDVFKGRSTMFSDKL